jgi:hypothetical protein
MIGWGYVIRLSIRGTWESNELNELYDHRESREQIVMNFLRPSDICNLFPMA